MITSRRLFDTKGTVLGQSPTTSQTSPKRRQTLLVISMQRGNSQADLFPLIHSRAWMKKKRENILREYMFMSALTPAIPEKQLCKFLKTSVTSIKRYQKEFPDIMVEWRIMQIIEGVRRSGRTRSHSESSIFQILD